MTALAPLYQLAGEYREAADRLHDMDLDEQTIADTLESMSGELTEKATNVAFVIRNMEAMAIQIKEAETRMAERRKALENRAKRMKEYLQTNMERAGISKIESPYFVLSLRNNPESVDVIDESAIPADYLREIPAKYEPDKALIKTAIKDGFAVPGCALKRTQSLSIK